MVYQGVCEEEPPLVHCPTLLFLNIRIRLIPFHDVQAAGLDGTAWYGAAERMARFRPHPGQDWLWQVIVWFPRRSRFGRNSLASGCVVCRQRQVLATHYYTLYVVRGKQQKFKINRKRNKKKRKAAVAADNARCARSRGGGCGPKLFWTCPCHLVWQERNARFIFSNPSPHLPLLLQSKMQRSPCPARSSTWTNPFLVFIVGKLVAWGISLIYRVQVIYIWTSAGRSHCELMVCFKVCLGNGCSRGGKLKIIQNAYNYKKMWVPSQQYIGILQWVSCSPKNEKKRYRKEEARLQ